MSDNKKPETPLKNTEIGVKVTPKNEKNPEHKKKANEVRDKLREKVEKALEVNKPGGKERQFDAVGTETKKAGQGTNPSEIKEIKVTVRGTDDEGDKITKEWSVFPKEGKPTP